MRAGEFEAANIVSRTVKTELSGWETASRFVNHGPQREHLAPLLRGELQHRPQNLTFLRCCLTVFESIGALSDLRLAMKLAFEALDRTMLEGIDPREADDALYIALQTHHHDAIAPLEKFVTNREATPSASEVSVATWNLLKNIDVNPAEVHHYLRDFANGQAVKLRSPSVVFRLSTEFPAKVARRLQLQEEGDPSSSMDTLIFANRARKLGLDVKIVPQFCNPGPLFAAPFDITDENLISVVGFHKYSFEYNPKLMNYRAQYMGRRALDPHGYSGWMKMPRCHEIGSAQNANTVINYFESKRKDYFGDAAIPDGVPTDRPYLFLPLQLEGDSVRKWGFVDIWEMVRLCHILTQRMGWSLVIKRHPKDKFILTERVIEAASKMPGVFIATAPSRSLVWHASGVAVVNSSVGWEAVVALKPIISFGHSEYAELTTPIRGEADLDRFTPQLIEEKKISYRSLFYYFFEQRLHSKAKSVMNSFTDYLSKQLEKR